MDNDETQEVKLRKKKYSKKGESVPSDNLGFRAQIHADIIDPKNIKRTRLRNKYYCCELEKSTQLSPQNKTTWLGWGSSSMWRTYQLIRRASYFVWQKKVNGRT